MIQPDDNTKWIGWRIGSELTKLTEEVANVKEEISNLNRVLLELTIKLESFSSPDSAEDKDS